MNWILFFIIFILTFFVYIHIRHHYKIVNDIEIYDMGYVNKKQLEEVCILRQPITFLLEEELLDKYFNLQLLLNGFSNMKINVYEISNNSTIPIPVTIKDVEKLFLQKKKYVSYNNTIFVDDSITKSKLQALDKYLSPPITIFKSYDVWLGTEDVTLPKKSESYYREYLYITSGYIECLLITPNNEKKQSIIVRKSEVLYIPPYWSYEITFKKNAFICIFRYDTTLSILSRLPQIVLDYIDNINTTKISLKLKSNEEINTNTIIDVSNNMLEKSGSDISKKIIDPSNNIV
tara:strand:+ start:2945 stop:3814 length:870 start_codon:yes stop_codon:yes gene_type:complete